MGPTRVTAWTFNMPKSSWRKFAQNCHPAQEPENSRARSFWSYEKLPSQIYEYFFCRTCRYNLSDLVNHILIIQTDYSWPKKQNALKTTA